MSSALLQLSKSLRDLRESIHFLTAFRREYISFNSLASELVLNSKEITSKINLKARTEFSFVENACKGGEEKGSYKYNLTSYQLRSSPIFAQKLYFFLFFFLANNGHTSIIPYYLFFKYLQPPTYWF